jgi:hypothetical protein
MATSVWDSAVTRCNIESPPNTQKIIIARLRRVPKKGGVIDILNFELSGTRETRLKIECRRHYTTIPFKRLPEDAMTRPRIPSGDHQRAIAFMLYDLRMLTVKTRDPGVIHFTTTNADVLPSVLRSYMRTVFNRFSGGSTRTISQRVEYGNWFISNTGFNKLNVNDMKILLGQILSTLSEDGWYLNCGGRRMSLTTSPSSLRAMAEYELLRHGRRRDQNKWDDLIHARSSDSSSGSSSGSESDT